MDPALITGATAVATGLLGYSGARLQHRAERDRLAIDRDRVALERTRLEKELEQNKDARFEKVRESKCFLYQSYLEKAEIPWFFCQRREAVVEQHLDEWWLEYQAVRRELKISGSDEVVDGMLTFNEHTAALFVDLVGAVRQGEGDEDKAMNARLAVWSVHKVKFETSLRSLEALMRSDVAA
jgi:hypothetical protein